MGEQAQRVVRHLPWHLEWIQNACDVPSGAFHRVSPRPPTTQGPRQIVASKNPAAGDLGLVDQQRDYCALTSAATVAVAIELRVTLRLPLGQRNLPHKRRPLAAEAHLGEGPTAITKVRANATFQATAAATSAHVARAQWPVRFSCASILLRLKEPGDWLGG